MSFIVVQQFEKDPFELLPAAREVRFENTRTRYGMEE